jgi:multidrug efflux system outer membrane protein
MRSLVAFGAVLALSACSTAIVQPAPKQVVSARFAAGAPRAETAIDLDWWASLNDPQLDELLKLARESSPDLRSAAAAVMKARAAAGQSSADLYPSLTGTADHTVVKEDGATRQRTDRASLDASWELDLFGRASKAAAASRLSAAAEEADFAGAFTSLSAEVVDYYVQYRGCRMIEAIYRQSVASQAETRKATADLTGAGLSPEGDLALAEANAATTAISLESQHADCRVIAQSLAVIVGTSQGQIDAILAKGGGLPAAKAFRISEIPTEALRQRPDVIEAELNFASAMKTMGAAKADLFPKLSLGGAITLTDPTSWSLGPALSLPILDGGAGQARLRSANADAITAGETWRLTVLTAVAEIEGALTRLNAARKNLASARSAVAGYQTYFSSIDDSWKAGGETLLNREEARRSLQAAQVAEVQEREAEIRHWIALYKAAGGGWTQLEAVQ